MMASTSRLSSLADELITMILQHARVGVPAASLNLCLVNKQFYRLETSILHQTAVVTPEKLGKLSGTAADGCGGRLRGNIGSLTRGVTIKGSGFDCVLLETVLDEMKQLDIIRWISWSEPIPEPILDCLSTRHPNCAICLDDLELGDTAFMASPRHDLTLLEGISGCQNIWSIDMSVNYDDRESTRQIKAVLMSCKNLEVLRLRAPFLADRMKSGHEQIEHGAHDLCVEAGDQLSSLRELVYESYEFSPQPRRIPPTFWDWEKITHLEIRGRHMDRYVDALKGLPTSLAVLKIENIGYRGNPWTATQALTNFLSSIHGLVDLTLANVADRLPTSVFAQHGATLKRLCYHHVRAPYDYGVGLMRLTHWAHPLSQSDLVDISKTCPNIESLAVNMHIHYDLDYSFMSTLARFPSLSNLSVYIDFYVYRRCHLTSLEAELLAVRFLVRYFIEKKVGCALKKIEMIFGDKQSPYGERRYEGGPLITFTMQAQKNGDFTVEYESPERNDPGWEEYFDTSVSSKRRGHTYLEQVLEWNKIGDEADETISAVAQETDDDEMASLFGDTSEVEDEAIAVAEHVADDDDMLSLFGDTSEAEDEGKVNNEE